jgi:ABC-2 type transport system permease protein
MLNEAYKSLLHLWSYRYNTLAEMVQRCIGFMAIGLLLGRGQLEAQQMGFVLCGWIMTFYARTVLFQVNDSVSEEARTGTLEQMYMSPVPSSILLLGRVLAILTVTTIEVSLSAIALALLLGIHLPLRWEVLPVIALTLLGLFGFSFFLGGVALVYKNVHSVADLTQDLLLFVNGTFISVSLLPIWLRTISLVLPTTYGITIIRAVVLQGNSLSALLSNGSLLFLAGHSAAYFLCGWLFYKWCESVARRQGSLGKY